VDKTVFSVTESAQIQSRAYKLQGGQDAKRRGKNTKDKDEMADEALLPEELQFVGCGLVVWWWLLGRTFEACREGTRNIIVDVKQRR
jgi:hypothetical protein